MTESVGAMERAAKALEHYVLHPRTVAVEVILAFLDEGEDTVFSAIFDHEGSCTEQAKAAIRALRALAQEKQP